MAVIIDARVQQKTDTETQWLANPLKLLSGECAFVVSDNGDPINFKIGDGTKTFAELPYWIQYDQGTYIMYTATPSVAVAYTIVGEGTYGSITVGADKLSVLGWTGGVWTKNEEIDLPRGADGTNGLNGATLSQLFNASKVGGYAIDEVVRDAQYVEYISLSNNNTAALSDATKWRRFSIVDSFSDLKNKISVTYNKNITFNPVNKLSRISVDYSDSTIKLGGNIIVVSTATNVINNNAKSFQINAGSVLINDIISTNTTSTRFVLYITPTSNFYNLDNSVNQTAINFNSVSYLPLNITSSSINTLLSDGSIILGVYDKTLKFFYSLVNNFANQMTLQDEKINFYKNTDNYQTAGFTTIQAGNFFVKNTDSQTINVGTSGWEQKTFNISDWRANDVIKRGTSIYYDGGIYQAPSNGDIITTDQSPRDAGSFNLKMITNKYLDLVLRGGRIFVLKNDNSFNYYLPDSAGDRGRSLLTYADSALRQLVGRSEKNLQSVSIPDGTLDRYSALVYRPSTNTLHTLSGVTAGTLTDLERNDVILLYNNGEYSLGGALAGCIVLQDSKTLQRFKVENFRSNKGSSQGTVYWGNNNYTPFAASNDEHTNTSNFDIISMNEPFTIVKSLSHNFGHMNSPFYKTETGELIVGNGSNSYTLPPKAWVFPNFYQLCMDNSTLDINVVPKITFDFSVQFPTESKCQLVLDDCDSSEAYLITNDMRTIRKLKLGKGTDVLSNGVLQANITGTDYNGTYDVIWTKYNNYNNLVGGIICVDSTLYCTGRPNRMYIISETDDMYVNVKGFDLFISDGVKVGEGQGIFIKDDYIYYFDGLSSCKFLKNKLIR